MVGTAGSVGTRRAAITASGLTRSRTPDAVASVKTASIRPAASSSMAASRFLKGTTSTWTLAAWLSMWTSRRCELVLVPNVTDPGRSFARPTSSASVVQGDSAPVQRKIGIVRSGVTGSKSATGS